MKELKLTIVSPEKELFKGEVKRVTLPGTKGSFTILPKHAPIVSSLTKGKLSYVTSEGTEKTIDIRGGFIEMNDNNISVCVN